MYAVVRINQDDPDRARLAHDQLREFDQTHSAQPGYRGTLTVGRADYRNLVVNLWDSEQHATAARTTLSPIVRRLLNPVLSQPSQLLGAGPVLALELPPSTRNNGRTPHRPPPR